MRGTLTDAQIEALAPSWVGFAESVANGYPLPPGIERDDWRAEARLGLVEALRRWRSRPGDNDLNPGRFAFYVRRVVSHHLNSVRRSALAQSRTAPGPVVYLDSDIPGGREGSEPATYHDVTPGRAQDPADAYLVKESLLEAMDTGPVARAALAGEIVGEDQADTAARLGVSRSAVSMALSRVRRRAA